ncbi:NAD-dependent epimerase/dehydratase family protein [Pedobacter sp.]|uniref:NAD-dependent epimerase/dehydratase family protein n=1 Tax=Pedobacter sp. TaxID=1411316 RepID=UPI003BAC79B4
MNLIITGATGYVGRNLISLFLKSTNHKLFAIVRGNAKLPKEVEVINDDADLEVNLISANPDIVIHLASYVTSKAELEEFDKLVDANIIFGNRLLYALKNTSIKHFINVGTFAEYHFNDGDLNPTYLYAATKTAFKSVLKYYSELKGFKYVHVVPYSIYGGVDRQKKIMDILFESLDAEKPTDTSQGIQNLDFIHINDVVEFFLRLVDKISDVKNNDVLYLGTGKTYTLREVSTLIEKLTNKKMNINWGAHPPRERDTFYACAPIGKIQNVLGWKPNISLLEGLKLKFAEYKDIS